MNKMRIVFKWLLNQPVLLLILTCILSRLPQLCSDHLFLDGDECIVGLMAKHFSEGKDVPYFFYGQSYGFTFVEVFMIRIFYLFFGITDIAVKLAMLSLWTLGILFFYKTLKQIGLKDSTGLALLITVLFVVSPSFAIWSMKARGGYLTAFLCCWIITYVMCNKKNRYQYTSAYIIGVLIIIVYQAQALWLAGLTPLLMYWMYINKNLRFAGMLTAGMCAAVIVFYFLKINLSTFWVPPTLDMEGITLKNIFSIPNVIFENMTGSYDNSNYLIPAFSTRCIAAGMTFFIFVNLVIGFVFFIRKKNIDPLYYVLCFSVVCSFSYLILFKDQEHRYLLPLSGFVFVLLYVLIGHTSNTRMILASIAVFIVLSAFSMFDFKNYSDGNKSSLLALNKKLMSIDAKYIYCEGGLVQWQIMFYSKEKIIARCKGNIDRYPAYIESVDNAFSKRSAQTALVGSLYEETGALENFIPVDTTFFIIQKPSQELLISRGFNLKKNQ